MSFGVTKMCQLLAYLIHLKILVCILMDSDSDFRVVDSNSESDLALIGLYKSMITANCFLFGLHFVCYVKLNFNFCFIKIQTETLVTSIAVL